ncbi:MAG: hypothetical protein ACLFPS_04365 [Clostridia bacterium]
MNRKILIFLCSVVSVYLTWFINHSLNLSPILANGIVGVLAIVFLPKNFTGIAYTSSFVGMSGMSVLPNFKMVILSGLIVAFVIIATPTVYKGIGGKGGTSAAISSTITRTVLSLIG